MWQLLVVEKAFDHVVKSILHAWVFMLQILSWGLRDFLSVRFMMNIRAYYRLEIALRL